jgi:hypothetical protein
MATALLNPNSLAVQPDPVLTNLMQDNSKQGGWIAPLFCPVKQVAKDYVRWGKQDSQSLLANLYATIRTQGARYNLIPRGTLTWMTSQVQEDAVRSEYQEEDIVNSISPLEPAMNAAMKILNVLQYATEARVQALAAAATFTDAADAAWSGAAGSVQSDIQSAKLAVLKNSGMAANFISIDPTKIPFALASTELKNLQIFTHSDLLTNGGYPAMLFGLRLFTPGARYDTTPTGTFTPAFAWQDGFAYVGYSPNLALDAYWSGDGQSFATQFENQINGSAFECRTRLDPDYEENLTHIVYGNVRRSLPEVFNNNVLFRITGI